MYNLELINWFLSANNYMKIRDKDAPTIINREIDDLPDGMFNGKEDRINSPLLSHLASAGYHAQLITEYEEKILEVWVPGLVVFKQVDWSIIQYKGTTIQQQYYKQVDKLVGGHIRRGDRVEVTVNYNGNQYNGFIRNVDRNVAADTYQFFYSNDANLDKEVSKFFEDQISQLGPHKPAIGHSYFELLAAREPQVVILNLYNGQMDLARGIQFQQYICAFSTITASLKGD